MFYLSAYQEVNSILPQVATQNKNRNIYVFVMMYICIGVYIHIHVIIRDGKHQRKNCLTPKGPNDPFVVAALFLGLPKINKNL